MAGPPDVMELRVSGVDYVIRAEPTGLIDSPLPVLSSIALMFTTLRRLVRRDRTWTIADRERRNDPFGETAHREVLPSRMEAAARLDELVSLARSGEAPWSPRRDT